MRPARLLCPAALIAVAALLCALASTAGATTEWGELGHVHIARGSGTGEITFKNSESLLAFAADSTDRAFYVADEPNAGEFRIQRFSSSGTGEAAISFKPPVFKEQPPLGLQLAVESAHGRVYALLAYKRRGVNEQEEKEQAREEEQKGSAYERSPLDSEELAAGLLYAFEYTGGKFVSAKTKNEEPQPVLGKEALKLQGENPKEALLNPRGIAVDPSTGNVAILGVEDEEPDLAVEQGAEKQCRAAVQVVLPIVKSGQLKEAQPGARFADTADVLNPEETTCEPEEQTEVPISPVFTPSGNLLISAFSSTEGEGEIWEVPMPSAKIAEEQEFTTTPTQLYSEKTLAPLIELTPPEAGPGPTMSFASDGSGLSGKLYVASKYQIEAAAVTAFQYTDESGHPGHLSEIGWTAGGEKTACEVPQPFGQSILLGAFNEGAGNEGVDVFDAFAEEITLTPRIEDFVYGPGGSTNECPRPVLTDPVAAVGDNPEAHEVPIAEKVTISSNLTGANVDSVEWKLTYKNGTEETSETKTTAEPKFESEFKEGEYEIGEVVHTDDLADQEVTASKPLKLKVIAQAININFAGVKAVRVNEEEATLEAKVTDPNEANSLDLKRIVWEFGDGSSPIDTHGQPGESNPTTLVEKHKFASRCAGTGGKCTVKLTVEDSLGAVKTETISVAVTESKAEEEARIVAELKAKEEAARQAKEAGERQAKEAAERQTKEAAERQATAERQAKEVAERQAKEAAERQAKEAAEKGKAKTPIRAELLAKALKSCKKQPKAKRVKCEAAARKSYGSKPKHKKKRKK